MNLFKLENYKAVINKEEVGLISEFKGLLELKYNKQKGDVQGRLRLRAHREFSYIYHLCDYRSEYSEYSKEERSKEALIASELPEDYKISVELEEAINKYNELQETRILKLLKSANNAIDKIRGYYDNLDFTDLDSNGKLMNDPNRVLTSINGLSKTIDSLSNLEKRVKESMKADAGIRGDSERGFL